MGAVAIDVDKAKLGGVVVDMCTEAAEWWNDLDDIEKMIAILVLYKVYSTKGRRSK